MTTPATSGPLREPPRPDVLERLEEISRRAEAGSLAEKLADLRAFLDDDMRQVEASLNAIDRRPTPLHDSAHHLLDLGGKRLRPLCVALAARFGSGFGRAAREIAVAVELVHSATLLHDDVVDLGDVRRGAPAARLVYGNAASIFAGDWLLVEALSRVQSAGIPGLLERVIGVLKEMLEAEALQLANRGSMRGSVADYFKVVEGKTASLFRWGLYAGGRAGGVDPALCASLEAFGHNVGVAFQVVDDVLDLDGESAVVGKSLFADLREGKATYPLLCAVEHDPPLGELIEAALRAGAAPSAELEQRVVRVLRETGAVAECYTLARRLSAEALESLSPLPAGPVRDALERVAVAMLHRRK
jgi:octaprenyl-diphosphate synthase